MIDRDKCPMCADGEVMRSEGQLDQSGATYLPTSVWTCNACGYVRYDPAQQAHWQPLGAPGVQAQPCEMHDFRRVWLPSPAPVERRSRADGSDASAGFA